MRPTFLFKLCTAVVFVILVYYLFANAFSNLTLTQKHEQKPVKNALKK